MAGDILVDVFPNFPWKPFSLLKSFHNCVQYLSFSYDQHFNRLDLSFAETVETLKLFWKTDWRFLGMKRLMFYPHCRHNLCQQDHEWLVKLKKHGERNYLKNDIVYKDIECCISFTDNFEVKIEALDGGSHVARQWFLRTVVRPI